MKRIIILLSHPLFGQGVETLLRRQDGLEIVARERDADKVVKRIRELRPDVIIVDAADPLCETAPLVLRIMKEKLGIRIVALNLENNTMCVYREEQRVVHEVQDLLEAIVQPVAA